MQPVFLSADYLTALFDAGGYFRHSIRQRGKRQQHVFKVVLSLRDRPDLLCSISRQFGGSLYQRRVNGQLTLEWHNRKEILILLRFLRPQARSSMLAYKMGALIEKLEALEQAIA